MKIYDYMAARADNEGKKHTLSREHYEQWVNQGMRCIFGVLVDDVGTPICDEQNPMFFEEWIKNNLPGHIILDIELPGVSTGPRTARVAVKGTQRRNARLRLTVREVSADVNSLAAQVKSMREGRAGVGI